MGVDVVRQAVGRTKVVDAPVLNRLGLQVGRTLAASARRRIGPGRPAPGVARAVQDLAGEGVAVLPDFLDAESFREVAAVARRVDEDPGLAHVDRSAGGNDLRVTWRLDVPEPDRNVLDRFFADPRLLAVLAAAERLELEPGAGRATVQRLVQRDGAPDREAELHSDTFHATHKAWLYLTDVTAQDGPLVYHPGSQRLSVASLRGTYRHSTRGDGGSRRIDERELRARATSPTVFTCTRNTLVVANTFGYHGRLQGWPPGERLVLHLELRPDPLRRPRRLGPDPSRAGAGAAPGDGPPATR